MKFGLFLMIGIWGVGCNGAVDNRSDTDTDAADDSDAGTDADTCSDADTDADTDADVDTDTECVNVIGCGGNLVGTWSVTSSCLTVSGMFDLTLLGLPVECTATIEGDVATTGTWTAYADGTYSDSTVTTGTETIEVAAACLDVHMGVIPTCDRLSGPIASAGYDSVVCTDNPHTGGCTCPVVIDRKGGLGIAPSYTTTDGSYTSTDSVLTIAAGVEEYTYCVEGTALTMTPMSTALTGTITGSVVLQKR